MVRRGLVREAERCGGGWVSYHGERESSGEGGDGLALCDGEGFKIGVRGRGRDEERIKKGERGKKEGRGVNM